MKKQTLGLLALVLALMLTLGACGTDTGSNAANNTAAPDPSATVTETPGSVSDNTNGSVDDVPGSASDNTADKNTNSNANNNADKNPTDKTPNNDMGSNRDNGSVGEDLKDAGRDLGDAARDAANDLTGNNPPANP